MPEPRRILVRGVNWLGDAVMTTPALARLRERFPAARISLLTAAKLQPLWISHPGIDDVLTFDEGESPWKVGRRLRELDFDVALVFPNSPRSALECCWGRVPLRVGYARRWRNLFLNLRIPIPASYRPMRKRSVREVRALMSSDTACAKVPRKPASLAARTPAEAHHIHHYLHLVEALGASARPLPPRLMVTGDEIAESTRKFGLEQFSGSTVGPGGRILIGLNPGAEYGPAKRWPARSFVEAAAIVSRGGNVEWAIFGGAADQVVADEITAGLRAGGENTSVHNLAGKTSLRELMALLVACRVLLTNDTGPMHVAAALGTRVVVPFGSTSPDLSAPGLPGDARHSLLRATVACAPCFLRTCPIGLPCMQSITPEQVAAALLKAID